jgi:hypothetical protein
MSTTPDTPTYAEDEETYDEDYRADEQAPVSRRPRRRLLTPLTALLFAVLVGAGGFIVGVQVEKGEVPAGSGSGAGAGRFAAALGAASGGAGATGAAGAAGASGAVGATGAGRGSGASGFGAGGGSGGAGATVGQVAYVSGHDLYVSTLQGNTVKVRASAAQITKSVSTSIKGVHPGDTVIVTGATGSDGAVTASSIRDSGSGGAGGGLGALFGGGSGGASSAGGATGAAGRAGAGSGGEPALFGK